MNLLIFAIISKWIMTVNWRLYSGKNFETGGRFWEENPKFIAAGARKGKEVRGS